MTKAGVWTPDRLRGVREVNCDVLVIGSGAGGGTMAAELAEAGFDVAIVEEGGYFTTEHFKADPSAMVRTLYRDGGTTVALGSPPVLYQEGSCVGGSTVVNGGMSWRTPEPILDAWAKEQGLHSFAAQQLDPYFDRVERRINVGYQDPETIGRDNQLLKQGADNLGWQVIPNRRNQIHCAGSNNCAFGCPTGAKQSVLVTYIERALHFGAQLYPRVRIDKVKFKRKQAIGAVGRLAGTRQQIVFNAKLTVISCGAIHTPALLHRSGYRNPTLGQNLTLHPNVKVVALFDEDIRGWEGVHQAYQVREFRRDGMLFAAVNVPPSAVAMSLPFTGQRLHDIMAQYDKMLVAGLLIEDTTSGVVRTMPGGRPQAFYQLCDDDFTTAKGGLIRLSELLFSTGARQIILPFEDAPICRSLRDIERALQHADKKHLELLTVHLMGTARTSKHPKRGVVDENGCVHNTAGLVVADASVFPGPIGVNPAETIQTLATHHAARIIENRRRYEL